MPQVASDAVIQRPVRPEATSGRAGAPAGEPSASFDTLLDAPAAPKAERPERAPRTRPPERSDHARVADDRSDSRSDVGRSRMSGAGPDAGKKPDLTDKPSKASGSPPIQTARTAEQNSAAPADVLALVIQATAVEASGDGQPVVADAAAADAAPEQTPDTKRDSDIVPPADATSADVTALIVVAVAAPAATPNALVADLAREAGAAPSEIQGSAPADIQTSAPAVPTGGATPQAAQPGIAPADITGPDATVPPPDSTAVPDESVVPAGAKQTGPALMAAGSSESGEANPVPAERKADAGKAKADHQLVARSSNAQAHADGSKSTTDAAAEQPSEPAAHRALPQSVEHASAKARAAVAEAHSELPANAAAPAQLNAAAPNVPFLAAALPATPLAGLWPVAALRIDPTADNAVPVAGLAVEIVSRAQDGLRRFDIRLDPPELGRIDVRLDVDNGGKVTSRLTVERAETLDLLRRDAPQLERALQHAGLNTEGGLEFSLRDQNFANREQMPRDVPVARLIVPDDEQIAAEAARRGYGRLIGLGGGVDITV